MPDMRQPDGQEADLWPREDLLVAHDAQVRDGAALRRGGVRRLGRGNPVRLSEDGHAAVRPGKKAIDG
jgi:hypothetical protein